MIPNMPSILILVLLLIGHAGPGAAADSPFTVDFRVETFANGLTVVLAPMDSPGAVAFWTVVRAGARNEVEPGKTGYAHLFEHLMFRGTERYPKQEYHHVMGLMGADHNAFTSEDFTAYNAKLPSGQLPLMIEVQADRFQNLRYNLPEYEKETGAVLGEFLIGRGRPGTILHEELLATAFASHTYRHTVGGWEEDVRAMPAAYDYSWHFFDLYYRPNNCAVIIAGDFAAEATLALLHEHFDAWERGGEMPLPQAEPPQTEARRKDLEWEGPASPMILMGFHAPAFSPDGVDVPALEIARELAFGPTSSFHRRWVEQTMKAQSLRTEMPRQVDPPLFTVNLRLSDAADLEPAREDILGTLAELGESPPSQEELDRVRSHLRYTLSRQLDNPGSVAYQLASFYELAGDPRDVHRYFAAQARVTPQDIQRVARRFLVEKNSTTITLVSKEGS